MQETHDRLDEHLLVVRCQAGDELAFEEIVRVYGDRLHYYLLKLLGSRESAEDTAQDVWLDVYRGIVRLRDPAAFRPWFYRIARARAFRFLRRRRSHQPLADEIEEASDELSSDDFDEEDACKIHAALDTLSTHHREVLLLRFIEEASYEEIGQIIGCSIGTTKSRIHYTKRMMRRAIESEAEP